MFSRTKSLLKIVSYQSAFRTYSNQAAKNEGLESFLRCLLESPPKQDYSPLFFDHEVQNLLKDVTNMDLKTVFRVKPLGEKVEVPKYKLLTDEELEMEMETSRKKAMYMLQIPPLVNITEDKTEIIDSDTSLDGFDKHHSKYVFVDVSLSKANEVRFSESSIEKEMERIVFVREPNGVLRTGSKSERFRGCQIFYPIPGRELETPKMFLPEYLMDVIKRKDYEFILDRACAQFEPDDEEYHQVISLTYSAINYCKDFHLLQSTRHYGSLAFYLVTHKNIDNILAFHIENFGIENAFSLVKLYHILHPKCKSAEMSEGKTEQEVLEDFIQFDSNDKDLLKNALEEFLAKEEAKKELERGMKEAHGLQKF